MLVEFEQGIDGYVSEAMSCFKIPREQVTKDQRQVGKVCFAAETEILTNNGWKSIVSVAAGDLLWDGEEWVPHGGLLDQGEQAVIELDGLRCTPEHEFWTGDEWVTAKFASESPATWQAVLSASAIGVSKLGSV